MRSATHAVLLTLLLLACKKPAPPAPRPDPAASASALPLTLPDVEAPHHDPASLRVYVTKADVRVGGRVIASLPVSEATVAKPLADALPQGADGALLAVDRETPFATVAAVADALFAAHVVHLGLATQHGSASGVLPIEPKDPARRPGIMVIPVTDGIGVKTIAANIAPGCTSAGAGITIPGRDYAALERCLGKLKAASPEEDGARVASSATLPAQILLETLATVQKVFPRTTLGL